MANSTGGLFHNMLAAATQASQHLTFRNAFFSRIYWDYHPIVAIPYQSITVTIPTVNEGDVVDIGGGPIQPTDTAHGTAQIELNMHFSTSFTIPTWDQMRTPEVLARKYVTPRMEALKRKMNRSIAQLVTTTNFATHALVSGSGADVFDRADLGAAWGNLAAVGVPVDDTTNLNLVTNVTAYQKMLAATAFASESTVGVTAAEAAQQRAVIERQFGAGVYWDQHIAVFNAGKQPGIFFHRYAIAGVTANPPAAASGDVDEMTVMVGEAGNQVPVQIQMQYSLRDQGTLVHIHCYWGVKVVRPEYGALLETA